MRAAPGDGQRTRLVGDLVKNVFPSYHGVVHGKDEAYLPLDKGLSVISRHAKDLGYDALILFLDELVLWLATHAGNFDFLRQEGQKLAKLVESQIPDRPAPIISFVARQRDLREHVGETITGAEQLGFADVLNWWEGRFHTITLEDRNLPVIAEKRVLRPKNDACKAELDRAFAETGKVREEIMEVLLTKKANRELFRKVYPFSPALVETLVAVSGALQRERTALRIMLEMLIDRGDRLQIGEVVPVGDLWDEVSQGEEAFTKVMHQNFEMARKLYHGKLLPLLEEEHGVSLEEDRERASSDPEVAGRLELFERDARLVKTLLLAAIVPEVETLKNLTPHRLAALNHGSIKSPIPGREGQVVYDKLQRWKTRVSEINFSDDTTNPTISLALVGVDIDGIIEQAKSADNPGARQRKLRQLLFEQFSLELRDDPSMRYRWIWKGTPRDCELVFTNVREASDETLRNEGEEWKVVVDFPFDAPGHTPTEDLERVRDFASRAKSARTLVWLPAFFSPKTQQDLGRLVVVDFLLRGEQLKNHSTHLSELERGTAREQLKNLQSALSQKILQSLQAAYGIGRAQAGMLDESFELSVDRFQSLEALFRPQPPVAVNLKEALDHLLSQALAWQYPRHPEFERDVKRGELRKVVDLVRDASRDPNGRVYVEDKKVRPIMRQIAYPLGLGTMGEDHFVRSHEWRDHFNRKIAETDTKIPSVRDLRAWMEEPKPMGLPRMVQDAVITVFAQQTQRSFALHGRTESVDLGKLPDEMELRPVELPPEDVWTRSLDVGGDVFGATPPSKLLDAQNLASFAGRVQDVVEEHRQACATLPGQIQNGLESLGVENDEVAACHRFRTAAAVNELVRALVDVEENHRIIEVLAEAPQVTSSAAMGTSLKSASDVERALRDADWKIFEGISRFVGDREAEAKSILGDLREGLLADEYVTPVKERLSSCKDRAVELLAPPAVAGTSSNKGAPKSATVERGSQADLDQTGLKSFASELEKKLDASDKRLKVTWEIYRKGDH